MSILDKILGYKKEEVAAAKTKADRAELEARARDAEPPRGFAAAAFGCTTNSDSVFHAPHSTHWPCHFECSAPQSAQT